MKQITALILAAFLMLSVAALADFDASIYTDEELIEIRSAIDVELDTRKQTAETSNDTTTVDNEPGEETPAEDFIYVKNGNEIRINAYVGSGTSVVIPSMIEDYPVTGIAANAFKDNDSIVSVFIPDTVTFIGEYAFDDCNSLASVRFPRYTSELTIEKRAFGGTDSLSCDIVLICDDITLGFNAFTSGSSQAMYVIASNLTITEDFIGYLSDLKTLYISGDTKITYDHYFWNTAAGSLIDDCNNLQDVYLPSDCDFLSSESFLNCSPRLTIYTAEEGKTTQAAEKAWLNFNTDDYATLTESINETIEALYPAPPRTLVTLQKGSSGKDVKLMQERLNELGYSCGTADGSYGNKSVQAISDFQTNNGLEVTGIADVQTQEVLFSDDAVAK